MTTIRTLLMILALTLAACASTIMEGHVGRDISAVIAKYGLSLQAFDLPDGGCAFQWEMIETSYVPKTIMYEATETRKSSKSNSTSSDGYVRKQASYFTFFTQPSSQSGWTIVGFEEPVVKYE